MTPKPENREKKQPPAASKAEIPIGGILRAARLAKNLTLGQVASASGLTQGFVSKLERDQVSPSVASLVSVCAALGIRVGELFDPPESAIVRAGQGAQINFGGSDAREYLLSSGNQTNIEVVHSKVAPGGSGGDELYSLNCEVEFVYVLAGTLDVILGPEHHILNSGDAMTFRGRDAHTWRNPTDAPLELLWVLSPAP
ncbi:MAG: helix-turn-helix transcriptional regulator [Actinomycetales bacterium]|nr:helix-turn-helix transcriptional regulator [Actinomycetales bacterium]